MCNIIYTIQGLSKLIKTFLYNIMFFDDGLFMFDDSVESADHLLGIDGAINIITLL